LIRFFAHKNMPANESENDPAGNGVGRHRSRFWRCWR
jgi:hypothetical protein